MKEKICIFAGTSEGRALAEGLNSAYSLTLCVATDYGKSLLEGIDGIDVIAGRMDRAEMENFIRENGFSRVIDATHPYAVEASENIRAAASAARVPLIRVKRKTGVAGGSVYVKTPEEAAEYLAGTRGNILLTTGAKELSAFSGLQMSRVWARVIPLTSSIDACLSAGVPTSHIIAMQGPFTRELNEATLRQTGAKWLVTKASGAAGGFEEKLSAAESAGAVPVIIGPPAEDEDGVSLDEALQSLLPPSKRLTLVGIGPGSPDCLTLQARRALEGADAVLGAGPVLECLADHKPAFRAFKPEDVRKILEGRRFQSPVLALRGDVGFYSAAASLRAALPDYDLRLIPGIASPVYFAARLGISWENVKLISLHGRDAGLIRAVEENRYVFALTGGENTVGSVAKRLCAYGFSNLTVTVGERLSCPGERVTRATAGELSGREFDSLSVMLIENPDARRRVRRGIPDGEFIRGAVPMTKAEVRSVCLSKLAPEFGSVIWDVGAGTGSVSVECALSAPEGRVYAVERSAEACELIRQNALKFRLENITVTEGEAPGALEALPAPTHVFVGGSSGGMEAVVEAVLAKNPAARIVATAVTLETSAELTRLTEKYGFEYVDAVSVSVAVSKKAGGYRLMSAQNPVTVFTMQGARENG